MEFELVPVDSLSPHPENKRRGDVEAIRDLIRVNGFRGAITAQRGSRRILAGEHRWRAAAAEGLTEVPVVWEDCDDETALRHVLGDNKASDAATYDEAGLAELLERVRATPTGLAGTGWDDAATKSLLTRVRAHDRRLNPLQSVDDVPPPQPAVTQRGDLWRLGEHRLLCGDATKRDEMARLMGDERADLLLTDPPYGVAFQDSGSEKRAILGDLTQAAVPLGFAVALDLLTADGRVYLFGGSAQFPMYLSLFDHHLRQLPRIIVWAKESFVMRPNGYHSQFELVYHGWKGSGGGPAQWHGDRKDSDLWNLPRDRDTEHPTQKPVAVCEIPLRNSCPVGGVALDPFAGSGTVLVAAEGLDRRCFAAELDPSWCDRIVARFERLTGQRAERA